MTIGSYYPVLFAVLMRSDKIWFVSEVELVFRFRWKIMQTNIFFLTFFKQYISSQTGFEDMLIVPVVIKFEETGSNTVVEQFSLVCSSVTLLVWFECNATV